jgi:hypothetical protein
MKNETITTVKWLRPGGTHPESAIYSIQPVFDAEGADGNVFLDLPNAFIKQSMRHSMEGTRLKHLSSQGANRRQEL